MKNHPSNNWEESIWYKNIARIYPPDRLQWLRLNIETVIESAREEGMTHPIHEKHKTEQYELGKQHGIELGRREERREILAALDAYFKGLIHMPFPGVSYAQNIRPLITSRESSEGGGD